MVKRPPIPPMKGDGLYGAGFAVVWLAASALLFWRALGDPNFGGDTGGYLLPVVNFVNGFGYVHLPGGELQTHQPPGYGLIALPFYFLTGDLVLAANVVPPLAYAATLIVVYRESRRLLAAPPALLAVLYLAFLPGFMTISRTALTDGPFTFLLIVAFFATIRILGEDRPHRGTGLLLGVTIGLGFLVRPEMLIVGFCSVGFWFGKLLWNRRAGHEIGTEVPGFLLAIFVAAVPIAAYSVFLTQALGHFALTGKAGPNIPWMLGQGMGYVPPSRPDQQGLSAFLRFLLVDNTAIFLANVAKNYWAATNKALVSLSVPIKILLAMMAVVAILSWRQVLLPHGSIRLRAAITLGSFACICPTFPSSLLFVYDRLLYPYLGIALIVMSWLTIRYLRALGQLMGRDLNAGPILILAAGLLFTTNFRAYHEFVTVPHPHHGLREGGLWLYRNGSGVSPSQVAVAGRGTPVYIELLGRKAAVGPESVHRVAASWRLAELAGELRARNARYLILAAEPLDGFPHLKDLWEHPMQASSYGLVPLHLDPGRRYQIYTLRDGAP